MLADKDRIFKNLYGRRDWGLAGARARGAWDGTKAILEKGRDAIIAEMKASGQRGRASAVEAAERCVHGRRCSPPRRLPGRGAPGSIRPAAVP